MVFHRPRWHTNHHFQGEGLFMTDASFPRTFEKFDGKGLPLNASGRDGIWLLDDDASMLKAVAVLDVWMPDMNGLEVQARLRRDSPKTRIIFITGRDDPAVRQTALDAGAFAFLAKPFEDEVLLQLIHKAATG